jgi:hypothetical protein
MTAARIGYTATLLSDGRVLIAGGYDTAAGSGFSTWLRSAEDYDPATGTITTVGEMAFGRVWHRYFDRKSIELLAE